MSNHKMQFPSHISKSWLSVCIFIFFLAVCVGLAIHVTSEEDAIHDLDYFLLRYGPKDVAKYVEDDSTVSKYYGTLPFYQ